MACELAALPNIGFDAKLILTDCEGLNPHEICNVSNVSFDLSKGEIDVTTRCNHGWRQYVSGLKEATLSFTMMDIRSDSGDLVTIRNAWNASPADENYLLRMKVLSAADGWGIDGTFVITGFNRNEDLESAVTVEVTARIYEFIDFVDSSYNSSPSTP